MGLRLDIVWHRSNFSGILMLRDHQNILMTFNGLVILTVTLYTPNFMLSEHCVFILTHDLRDGKSVMYNIKNCFHI